MDIKSIIRKKRVKQELTKEEIRYFVSKLVRGEITEAQASAVLSYIYINGLTEDEILYLSVAMAESGSEEMVIARPSMTMSFLGIPYLSAAS